MTIYAFLSGGGEDQRRMATAAFYLAMGALQWKICAGMVESDPGYHHLPVIGIVAKVAIEIEVIAMGIFLVHYSQRQGYISDAETIEGIMHKRFPRSEEIL